MRLQTRKNKLFAALMSVLAAVSLLVLYIPAAASADNSSVSLICESGSKAVADMHWSIYRIGERIDNEFVLTGDFAEYPVDLTDLSEENIGIVAKSLESLVVRDELPCLWESDTDVNGTATFAASEAGLYLAIAEGVKIEHNFYTASPLIFEIKTGDTEESKIFPKLYSNSTLGGTSQSYTVRKVWVDNDDNAKMRPVYVTVDLFKNGELFDTVTLNEENNWQFFWDELDPEAEWRVAEREIPVKYDVIVDYNSTQYLIKNTYNPSRKTGGGTATQTTTTTSTTTSVTSTTTTTAPVTTTTTPKLPQTGQLWWPVVPLAAGGVVMLILGVSLPKKKEDE